ncbi:type II restriction endonuclease [Flavihumibacter petaseus]|uniref:Type II restriction enzyme n=1 Tax=Flavihumibacter petaseus NBRC 106054 TaxID=1220578 RepID=A0A0E9N2R3_9BACT|nr:type II restriction endonuclease [Flavihumibacter petaseus]GAO44134.1 type II restriction enzyme [Flavihumibacter petaseus NBRC 106054]
MPVAEKISSYFSGIGAKRLSRVEVKPDNSNQHEFNGINAFKEFFGSDKIRFKGTFIFLSDDQDKVDKIDGTLTWYDARAKHPTRSEFRLYYTSNIVIEAASQDDLLIIARTKADSLMIIVAPEGSTSEKQLLWLFGLDEVGDKFITRDFEYEDRELGFAGKYILSELGIELVEKDTSYFDELFNRFGNTFPTTKVFSEFSRSTVIGVSAIEEPDKTLLAWLEREELLFKALEAKIVSAKLKNGFGLVSSEVEEFISFSLSVQNRRKSRAGHAFENNLAKIFEVNNIYFAKGATTERSNKPDFLFPGLSEYQNLTFPADMLTMLGVKTTAKDRWRQILMEADRVSLKHLITLEPSISKNQTDEMIAQKIQLILPEPLLSTYTQSQQQTLITLSQFLNFLKIRQLKTLGI